MKDADEYDRLWQSRGFEVDKTKSRQTPPNQSTSNPDTHSVPPHQTSQSRGTSRRDFLITAGVLGAGILALGYAARQRQEPFNPPPVPKPGPTEAPKPIIRPTSSPTPLPAQYLNERISPTVINAVDIDTFGTESIKRTFGIEVPSHEIPEVQFSRNELEKAKILDQILVLHIDKNPAGEPFTLAKIISQLQPKVLRAGMLPKDLFYYYDRLKSEGFIDSNLKPQNKWTLVTRNMIPGSQKKNYLEQTQLIADYLKTNVFNSNTPVEFAEAFDELNAQKPELQKLLSSDLEQATEKLLKLRINRLYRQNPAEYLFDILLYFASPRYNTSKLMNGISGFENYERAHWSSTGGDKDEIRSILWGVNSGFFATPYSPATNNMTIGTLVSR